MGAAPRLAAALLARVLYATLPEPWTTLANTSAIWGLVPFTVVIVTAARGSRAAVLGPTALVAMVATWAVLAPDTDPPRVLALAALLAGALFVAYLLFDAIAAS